MKSSLNTFLVFSNSPTSAGECGVGLSPLPHLDAISPEIENVKRGGLNLSICQDEDGSTKDQCQSDINTAIDHLETDLENGEDKDDNQSIVSRLVF